MTTETDSSSSGGDDLAVPLTGEGDSCYLCKNDATHVGQIAAGPFTSEVGLCEGCYLREVAEVPTSIDRTETWNHKKIRYSDGSVCFTYETDEGYYSVVKDSFFGIWDVDGPFDLPNAHVCGGTSVTDVSPTAIPGAAGNTVEITGVEVLPARDCSSDSFSAILRQRENPALPAKDEYSDALSEPRTEQGGSESRKLRATISVTVA